MRWRKGENTNRGATILNRRHALHWAWVILAVCFFDLFVNYSIRLGYTLLLPEMIRTLGFSRAAGGSIYNFFLFTYISITPIAGFLTDRFGARWVITICSLILGIGVFMMGTIQHLWMAYLFYAVAGLGATGMWTPVITLVQRWFAYDRRGMALGILSTGYGLGFATLGIVFPWVVHNFSWRYAWYFLGAAALVMFVVNGIFLRSSPEISGYRPWGQGETLQSLNNGKKKSSQTISFKILFKTNRFWVIGCSYFMISYSLFGITTFMADYAKYQLGLPLEKSSLLATIHGIAQVAGVLTILPLSDFLGRKKTIMISNGAITVALIGIVFSGNSFQMLSVFIAWMAIFYGVTFPIYGAAAGDYFPKEVMGTVIGAWTPFYGLGAIISHWVTGILRDVTGVYTYSFWINAIMAGLSFILISRLEQRTDQAHMIGMQTDD